VSGIHYVPIWQLYIGSLFRQWLLRRAQGLFSESLPQFLRDLDAWGGGTVNANFSYVHVDCDLYQGTADVLSLLGDRLAPGAVLIFDELVNHPVYRQALGTCHLSVCLSTSLVQTILCPDKPVHAQSTCRRALQLCSVTTTLLRSGALAVGLCSNCSCLDQSCCRRSVPLLQCCTMSMWAHSGWQCQPDVLCRCSACFPEHISKPVSCFSDGIAIQHQCLYA
jgi:hypothetical protein